MTESEKISNPPEITDLAEVNKDLEILQEKDAEKDQIPKKSGSLNKLIIDKNHPVKIQKIRLRNFLSFEYDEVILDPLFSIIWGPNGAGKSSVYQGLKFALGSNNYDGRYKKWADFIRTGQNVADVEVYFDINDEIYAVKRKIFLGQAPKVFFKNAGESTFRPSTARSIEKFLNAIKIDPNNVFSFMSQGNIDSIKDFKEDTLCNFVEKGIGLESLRLRILDQKARIHQLEKELSALITNNDNLKYQLIEMEPKLARLKKKKELQSKKKELNDELLWAQREEIILQIREYEEAIRNINRDVNRIELEIEKYTSKIQNYKKQVEKITAQSDLLLNHISVKTARKEQITEEINRWTAEKSEISDRINHMSEEIEEFQTESSDKMRQIKSFESQIDQLDQIISNINRKLTELRDEERKINAILQENSKIITAFTTKSQLLKDSDNRLDELFERLDGIDNEIGTRNGDLDDFEEEMQENQWFFNDPTPNHKKTLMKRDKEYERSITNIEDTTYHLEKEIKVLNTQIDKLKYSVSDKDMPKPRAIENLIRDIEDQQVECVGPLIDFINFDPKYQLAVESILTHRILYSFIAKDHRAFKTLLKLGGKNRANCSFYVERKGTIPNLPSLTNSSQTGVFGYLFNKITPQSSDPAILKVVYSRVGKTLVVEDHDVAFNYIKRYNFQNWVVTLDGEQIRPKKLVHEGQAYFNKNKEKISSVAQAKMQLNKLNQSLENKSQHLQEFNDKLEQLRDLKRENGDKARAIDYLLSRYSKMRISKVKLKKQIESKDAVVTKIEEKKQLISQLTKDIEKLKPKLPKGAFKQQNRLNELPPLITELQSQLDQSQNDRNSHQTKLSELKINLASLKSQLEYKIKEKDALDAEFRKQDKRSYALFTENIELSEELQKLNEEREEIQAKIKTIDLKIEQTHSDREEVLAEKIKLEYKINDYNAYITSNQADLDRISIDLEGTTKPDHEIRSIIAIQKNIDVVDRMLKDYADVDDNLLLEKQRIEDLLARIEEKRQILENEINTAQEAEMELEKTYYDRFQISLTKLQEAINLKLQIAEINAQVDLELNGQIENLGLLIKTSFSIGSASPTFYPLSALSGGQRSMVGICLMLSLHQLNPSPFNIYDEAEMFLDAKNAQTVAKLIHNLTMSGIQFVILMPDKSKTLVQLANKVIGISRNGKNGPSTVHYSKIFTN
jgi:chromosome segregation ATPase